MAPTCPLYVADVALASPGSGPAVLTYAVPPELGSVLRPGSVVHVTVRGRSCRGYVVELRSLPADSPLVEKLVEVTGFCDDMVSLSDEELALAKWLSEAYIAPIGDAIRAIRGIESPAGDILRVRLTKTGKDAACLDDPEIARSRTRTAMLGLLQASRGEVSYHYLRQRLGEGSREALQWLSEHGYTETVVRRSPSVKPREVPAVRLAETCDLTSSWTDEQQHVIAHVAAQRATHPGM